MTQQKKPFYDIVIAGGLGHVGLPLGQVGKYVPGTLIPVREEGRLFTDMPDYALLLSWHLADELIPKLRSKGFQGDFVIPLPQPRIVHDHA